LQWNSESGFRIP